MKLVIISTTINGEKGYIPFDKLAFKSPFSEVCFVISGDLNSKPFDSSQFQCEIEYLDAQAQEKWLCSDEIGWRKIQRRNIALLRAIEKKPDYILIIDDDNSPKENYFEEWHRVLTTPVTSSIVATSLGYNSYWYNYLKSSDAPIEIFPRGFPFPFRWRRFDCDLTPRFTAIAIPNCQIGVYQGISLYDPDIDAVTRLIYPNPIHLVREKNYCLQNVWSPYNTQNTMITKSLFPLAFVWPHCGRYDDIYSSFTWQKLLFSNDMYAFVGDPMNEQKRGDRDILKDMDKEIEGYSFSQNVWAEINKITAKDPIDFIHALINSNQKIIVRQRSFMKAFLQDLERIM